ncbi:glycosyltransferase [Novosphingobium bradum]|uniref:Glycosyltransferase n=1 Tax=Novosphingobium bradum TaxID=1737444 RepID=A0ABV7IRB7_9SPHN
MSGKLSGKRLLLVEEVLKDPIGHWYEYIKAVTELNRSEGAEVMTVAHARIDPAIATEIAAIPAFPRSSWDGDYYHPRKWRRYLGALWHNWLVYRTMARIVDAHGPFDCLFAPTVGIHQIWGWRLLFARKRARIGRIVLLFRMNAGTYQPGSMVPAFPRIAVVLKAGMRSFAGAIAKGQATLATDSTRLAREYELLCGIAPEVYPSPRIAPFPNEERPAKGPDENLVFSCLGPARFEKGIDLLQGAIKACLAKGLKRPVRFVIQWNHPIADAAGAPYLPDPALVADPRVDFITEALDTAAYDAAIAATDCMVLPYRRNAYYARISGVAVEAATAGIPMLYTTDTWMADLVEQVGAGIGAEDGDMAALASAITAMVENYDAYHAKAMDRRSAAQDAHSGGAFLDKLWGQG